MNVHVKNFILTVGVALFASLFISNEKAAIDVNNEQIESLVLSSSPLAGVYTIGPDPQEDYPDIDSAFVDLMALGISDTTRFLLRQDTMEVAEIISTYPGMSCELPVIIETDTSFTSQVTLKGIGTTNRVFALVETEGFQLRNLNFIINNENTTLQQIIFLANGASCNLIKDCNFQGSSSSSSATSKAIVYSPNSTETKNGNEFSNNIFNNGSYGIYFRGSSILDSNLVISNNEFVDQTNLGSYVEDHYNALIESNSFTGKRGLGYSVCNSSKIINNFILLSDMTSNSTYGIFSNSSSNNFIAHNTLRQFSEVETNFAIKFDSGEGNTLYNNIFSNEAEGITVSIDYENNFPIDTSNNNVYSTHGEVLITINGSLIDEIEEWQSQTGIDANSKNVDPYFTSTTSFVPTQYELKNAGIASSVDSDIEGQPRDTLPDIGAYEFLLLDNNMSLNKIFISDPIDTAIQNIEFIIQNQGNDTIHSYTFYIELYSEDLTTTYPTIYDTMALSGLSINPGDIDTLDKEYILESYKKYHIQGIVSMPNGEVDQNPDNDTLVTDQFGLVLQSPVFIGIDSVVTPDLDTIVPQFANISNFSNALSICGISDTLYAYLSDSLYQESVEFSNFPGMDCTRPVYIQPYYGDTVTVTSISSDYVIHLSQCLGLNFQSIHFQANSIPAYAKIIQLSNGSNCNVFQNNIFSQFPVSPISTAGYSVYSTQEESSGTFLDPCIDNVFKDNAFKNGYCGIYLSNELHSNSDGWLLEGNNVDSISDYGFLLHEVDSILVFNNVFKNTHNSIYSSNTSDVEIIQNSIEADNYGIYDKSGLNNKFTENHIQGATGIYTDGFFNGVQNDSLLIANNQIIAIDFGIYQKYSQNSNIVFNSIKVDLLSNSGRAYRGESNVNNVLLMNNILTNFKGGKVLTIPNGNGFISDYNDLYSTGGEIATGYSDLAAWQVTGFDQNSVSGNPIFVDSLDLHIDTNLTDCNFSPVYGAGIDTLIFLDYD